MGNGNVDGRSTVDSDARDTRCHFYITKGVILYERLQRRHVELATYGYVGIGKYATVFDIFRYGTIRILPN